MAQQTYNGIADGRAIGAGGGVQGGQIIDWEQQAQVRRPGGDCPEYVPGWSGARLPPPPGKSFLVEDPENRARSEGHSAQMQVY